MKPVTRRLRLGLRRETLILLPVALLLLVVLSVFTLLAFRRALVLVVEERRTETAALARRLADGLAGGAGEPRDLLRGMPPVAGVALVDEAGRAVYRDGDLPADDLLAPLAGRPAEDPTAAGLDAALPDRVAGFAPTLWQGRQRVLRVDVASPRLAGQMRALRTLSWVVLPVDFAVVLLVVLFLRNLMTPFDTMLARAREVEPPADGQQDEADYLVSTFERALARLAAGAAGPETAGDDLAALQRALGPSLESGVLILDRQARVLALNSFGADLLDVEPPAAGRPLDETLAGYPELAQVIGRAAAEGRSVQRRQIEVEIGESRRTLGLTVHPLRRDDGSLRAFLALFVDLTETRRRAEEERLSESLAQVGELAAGIAHEMRNSLAALTGYLTLIEREPEEEAITDYLTEIRHETDHLQRVLEDFLTFARPGSTRMETIDLERVVRRAAADPALGGAAVEVSSAGSPATIRGDGQLLERAVRNLLHNAAEAQRRAGRREPLEVRIGGGDGELELAIEDRGEGIPAKVREHLFEPFVTGGGGGVGLGLALARRIVDLHGGTVRIEDRAGGGTRAVLAFRRGASVT